MTLTPDTKPAKHCFPHLIGRPCAQLANRADETSNMRDSHACLGEKSGGGANDPTEKCSARRPCGPRHRRGGKFSMGRRIRIVRKPVERRHDRLAFGRAAAPRPLYRVGDRLPWLGPWYALHRNVYT